jgi:hypothetical protein
MELSLTAWAGDAGFAVKRSGFAIASPWATVSRLLRRLNRRLVRNVSLQVMLCLLRLFVAACSQG